MKSPAPPLSQPVPERNPASLTAQGAQRRHHGGSADLLRRLVERPPVAATSMPHRVRQESSLEYLLQALCGAMQGDAGQERLAGLVGSGWYDAPAVPDAEVRVRHAWPFMIGDCAIPTARMHCRARDGELQQLYLGLAGEALDMSRLPRQLGKMQASLAYQEGGPDDILFSCEQSWGRLGIVADRSGTIARALLLVPVAAAHR